MNFPLPATDWNWNNSVLTHYHKDAKINLRSPAFLVEGVLENTGDSHTFEAFEFIQPFQADELTVISDSCKILQCHTSKLGVSRASIDVGYTPKPAAISSVERRSLEMARPSLGNRLTSADIPHKSNYASKAAARGARGMSLDMSRSTTDGVQMKHLSTILAANALTKRNSPKHSLKPLSISRKQSLDLDPAPSQARTRFDNFDLPPSPQRMELSDISLSDMPSMKHPKQRISELKDLLEDQLIDKDEFEKQRTAILASI